jgi:hypothetical protein
MMSRMRKGSATCFVGPRLFLAPRGRAADLENRSDALHVLLNSIWVILSPGPPRLEKAPDAVHTLPQGGEVVKSPRLHGGRAR